MKQLSFLFTGDVMAHANQLKAAQNEETGTNDFSGDFRNILKYICIKAVRNKKIGTYDFSSNFRNILKYIRNVDVAVCNLETTLAGGEPTSYPRFNTPVELADAIAKAGFACVATANNHSYDSNRAGIVKTRRVLEKRNLKVAGTRKKPGEKAFAILKVQGIKVAILNYTYETAARDGWHTLNNRIMTPEAKRLLNSFSFETVEEDLKWVEQEIAEARSEGAQIILVYYHWGNEYERHSNVFQKYVAWRTAHMGVDAIIGSHAHVLQELGEIRVSDTKTVPVFYGLGNYIWGAPPIYERETVLNNILALLNITYDEETNQVQVTPSYVPLFIGQKENIVETIDMQSLPQEEYTSFEQQFGIHPKKVLEQVRDAVENKVHSVVPELYFDRIFPLKVGQRVSVLESFLPDKQYVEFRSEETLVASVVSNGFVVGNAPGYAGMIAVDSEGKETAFMVRVLPGEKSRFPVLVNEQNQVRDIYLPPNRVTGEEYGLGDKQMLCKPAAEAWRKMQLAAREDGIYIKAVHTIRFKIDQVKRRAKYAKIYGDAAARRRYHRTGCTEHHLGTVLDVAADTYNGVTTPKTEAYRWVQENGKKYGFVVRKFIAKIENVPYLHLRHLDDQSLVELLDAYGISVEDYIMNYDQYRNM